MAERDHLICPGKDHVMVSHDRPSPNSGNADLFIRAGFPSAAPVKGVCIFLLKSLINTVRQSQRCSAGRIQLSSVMLLHNLNIKASLRQLEELPL